MTPSTLAPTRTRRTKNYWEPIFEPGLMVGFKIDDWMLTNNNGPNHLHFSAESLVTALKNGRDPKFKNVRFDKCDFSGHYSSIPRKIVFEGCEFSRCDFGLSSWRGAKFTGCRFHTTSLTQSTFIDCEFRRCSWNSVGLSGNETKLTGTFIDNPNDFIQATYVNLDSTLLLSKKKSTAEQKANSEESKAVLARLLYNNLKLTGDEITFYRACKTHFIQNSKSQIFRAKTRFDSSQNTGAKARAFAALAILNIEMFVIRFFGFLNDWGASVSRSLIYMVLATLAFAICYHQVSCLCWKDAFAKTLRSARLRGILRVPPSRL